MLSKIKHTLDIKLYLFCYYKFFGKLTVLGS
jgi:hypothetical protein